MFSHAYIAKKNLVVFGCINIICFRNLQKSATLVVVPNQTRRLLATLTLNTFGKNRFIFNVSYSVNSVSEEPCIIDSRCRTVEEHEKGIRPHNTIPTRTQCMSITSNLGRNSCLQVIKRYEHKPLGFVETKAKLLRSAYLYTQDRINGTVRNLYDTVLQYRCPLGQKFSNSQQSNTANSIACLLYTSPSPRDATLSRMPSSA